MSRTREEAGIFRHATQFAALGIAALLVCAGSAESSGTTVNSPDIFVMNADGTGVVDLTNNPRYEVQPNWSPDGTKIAYSSDDQIFVMNADGTNAHAVTAGLYARGAPVWSPDGTKIAFVHQGIVVMNADGSDPVTLDQLGTNPSWSPSGNEIAFTRSDASGETHHIYSIRSDGSDLTQLTSGTEKDVDPAWSPDGSKIAFSRWASGSSDIFVMNPDGSGQTNLTNDPERDGSPAWSPDGTRIAFARDTGGINGVDLFVMNADGSSRVDLTNNPLYDGYPAWSPDGSRIAFVRYDDHPTGHPPPPPPPGPPPPLPPPPAARCHVPRVVGLRLANAQTKVQRAGCTVGRVRRARSRRNSLVVSQSPRAGAVLARRGKVNLVVGSRGPRR